MDKIVTMGGGMPYKAPASAVIEMMALNRIMAGSLDSSLNDFDVNNVLDEEF